MPEHRDNLLNALIEIGKELASTMELETLLERILEITRDVFHFENALIRLLDEKRQVLYTAASYGYADETCRPEIRLGQGIMGKVAYTRTPLFVDDLAGHPDYVPGIAEARSELAVPMVVRDRLIGVFNVESVRPHAFSEADIAPLLTLAGQAAVAIENARLYQNLRGVSNRYQKLHQFNSRILQSANLGIYTIDSHFTISSWNRTMEQLSGVTDHTALGKNLFTLFPDMESEFSERMHRVLAKGQPEEFEFSHRNQRGETRIQKRRLSPLMEGDLCTGVLVIVEDVTEIRCLLDQVVQSEKLAEVGRLTAGIAHEVNNPLAIISYASQLLQREEGASPFQLELLDRVSSEVERLRVLTEGLLSFSRAGETRRRPTDLNAVIADVLRMIHYEIDRHEITLEQDLTPLPACQADPNKLKQVFINLLMNAIQAMGDGGNLWLSTAASEEEICIVLRDNGPGIPLDLQNRIFEPFFTTKPEGEGTGLGLYICRNLIHEHEGRIHLDTPEEGGTRFTIYLPLNIAHENTNN
ncbi:MAG: hypothetical protein C0621_08040 [Desulfuromonas sp.]|nr:MAG: hypothetical protein C0621_08040 [Desulfuromonas sp.]